MDGHYQHPLVSDQGSLAKSSALAAGSLVYGFRQNKGIAQISEGRKAEGERRTPSRRAGSSTEVCLEGAYPSASCLLLENGGVVPSVSEVPPHKERSSTLRVADGSPASSTLRVDMITETPDTLLLGGLPARSHSYPVYAMGLALSHLGSGTSVDL